MYNAADVYKDLLSLREYFQILARDLYDYEGNTRLDRIVVPASQTYEEAKYKFPLDRKFGPYDEKSHRVVFAEAVGSCRFEDFRGFLSRNGVQAVSEFMVGSSAEVWLGKRESGNPVAIRIPQKYGTIYNHSRLDVPIVEQPLATMEMENVQSEEGGKIEILTYRPVLPFRGILMPDESRPEHSLEFHEEFTILGSDGSRREAKFPDYERALGSLANVLRISGFQIKAARDIALSPRGAPVFVDPDTVRLGRNSARQAYGALSEYLDRTGLFVWENPHAPFPSEADEMEPGF